MTGCSLESAGYNSGTHEFIALFKCQLHKRLIKHLETFLTQKYKIPANSTHTKIQAKLFRLI